jgi:hypothetical protein
VGAVAPRLEIQVCVWQAFSFDTHGKENQTKASGSNQYYGDICAKWVDGGFQACDTKERNYVK